MQLLAVRTISCLPKTYPSPSLSSAPSYANIPSLGPSCSPAQSARSSSDPKPSPVSNRAIKSIGMQKKESHERFFTHRHPTTTETQQLCCEQSIRGGGECGTLSKKRNAFAWRETHPPTRRRPPPVRCRRVSPRPARTGKPGPSRTLGRRTCRLSRWRARLGRARQRLRRP